MSELNLDSFRANCEAVINNDAQADLLESGGEAQEIMVYLTGGILSGLDKNGELLLSACNYCRKCEDTALQLRTVTNSETGLQEKVWGVVTTGQQIYGDHK